MRIPSTPRPGVLALGLLLSLAACGGAASSVRSADVGGATLLLDIETCEALAVHKATAVVVNNTVGGDVLAATVAHSLDRYERLVVTDANGQVMEATVAYVDLSRDIAFLRLTDWPATQPRLTLVPSTELFGHRNVTFDDGAVTIRPVDILRRQNTTINGEGDRLGFEISGDIQAGDSGSPVVDSRGDVIGIVFATARGKETGWATDSSEFLSVIESEDLSATVPSSC